MLSIAIAIVVVAAVLYWIYYKRRINKRLHDESLRARRLISPWAFSTIAMFVVLIAFAGLATFMALTDMGAEKVPAEYRHAIYDYQDFSSHEMTGYRSHFSIDNNPGYTKTVEQHGDIRFTQFIRDGAFDYYHPSFIIYAEYTGDKDILRYGVLGPFFAPDGRQMTGKGRIGYGFSDYVCVIGTSDIQSRFELTVGLFDSSTKEGTADPEDFFYHAVTSETISILLPNPQGERGFQADSDLAGSGMRIDDMLIAGFLSYPVLVISILVAIISISLLILKRETLKKESKALLTILTAIAVVVIAILIALSFAFGNNHPIAPPVPAPLAPLD
jgi:uncharacterized membrane protein